MLGKCVAIAERMTACKPDPVTPVLSGGMDQSVPPGFRTVAIAAINANGADPGEFCRSFDFVELSQLYRTFFQLSLS